MNEAYLTLGGNIPDRMEYLKMAILALEKLEIVVEKKSNIYETEAWGEGSSGQYLNMAVKIKTQLSSGKLMKTLLAIEKKLGRIRQANNKNANRTIDIDILFYNHDIINTEDLIIPHPRLALRRFVLKPLLEINQNLMHPILNKNIVTLDLECQDESVVKIYAPFKA
jgi:2-amino-4-hydroxy-6-hydroxymethyldihydropteridine diphosphokinase